MSKKKNKIPKLSEEEYNRYIAALKGVEAPKPTPFPQPNQNGQ